MPLGCCIERSSNGVDPAAEDQHSFTYHLMGQFGDYSIHRVFREGREILGFDRSFAGVMSAGWQKGLSSLDIAIPVTIVVDR